MPAERSMDHDVTDRPRVGGPVERLDDVEPATSRRRLRSAAVPVALVSATALALAGCAMPGSGSSGFTDEDRPSDAQCVDPEGVVVDDSFCDNEAQRSGGIVPVYAWWIPALRGGPRLSPGTRVPSTSGTRVDPATVSRGGFGTRSGTGSGSVRVGS